MEIRCIWEHHGEDTLLYAENLVGAYTRGPNKAAALAKMAQEAGDYCRWLGMEAPAQWSVRIIQEKESDLEIKDADSDVLFDSERAPLTAVEYEGLKALTLKSAKDFQALYQSISDPTVSLRPARQTFYGQIPATALDMYEHTKNVNAYYFGELGITTDNDGSMLACRERGFALLEQMPGYLFNTALEGSYGEEWSLRKVCRRFIWHDRLHAKAMYRRAVQQFGTEQISNPFQFSSASPPFPLPTPSC